MGCGSSTTATSAVQTHQNNNNNRQPRSVPSRPPIPQLAHLPLTASRPYRHGAPITSGELNNQRSEFWGTRTEGNAHMWQSIRSAAEALLANDLPLANAILEASNLITPNGTLEVVYDERGAQYKVPQYCYANPQELSTAPISATSNTNSSNNNYNNNSNNIYGSSASASNLRAVETQSTESVKHSQRNAIEDLGGAGVKLRVRINPGDHNLAVMVDENGTVSTLKQVIVREVQEKLPAVPSISVARQRIIFMGKELTNTMKIKECKFDDSKVVQVFLRPEQ